MARALDAAADGENAIRRLADEMVVIGTRLMDWYHGPLSPDAIGARVLAQLADADRLAVEPFRVWVDANAGYALVTLTDDGSRWTLRLGPEDGRYIHLHPARYSPGTTRVQANTLKTALLSFAVAKQTERDPADVAVVNEARARYLALPPIPSLDVGTGLGELIGLMKNDFAADARR
ncbi:hypothetical protein FRUB_02407 [Fimbriiglobus ruber]|uniref:Uncharacterized protein n=1 Tax=Fimbriiglobus ruber TaxID=1908690 RepID=A0A225E730_9BACT|nr:hypothetical protein FRUB_02407 [Fimbriiglobus ruber]